MIDLKTINPSQATAEFGSSISISSARSSGSIGQTKSRGFADMVKDAIGRVNSLENQADQSVEKAAVGEVGVHDAMIALQKADLSLRLLLQVRSKVLDAYKEVMRMPM